MTGAWAQDTDEVAVTKTANNNERTLKMPASDVELQVEYYENLNSADDLSALVTNFAGNPASVVHTRSFTADVPSTICLPFAMTSISGGKVYSLLNVTYDQTEKAWVATMNDATPDGNLVSTTEAGMPYLFMPAATGEVTFEGEIAEVPATVAGFTLLDAENNSWKMTGTYSRIDWTSEMGAVFGFAAKAGTGSNGAVSAGEFVRAGVGAFIPAYRAYLKYEGSDQTLQSRRANVATEEANPQRVIVRLMEKGETTGIATMNVRELDNKWYTLDGRQLQGQPTAKGLYIQNGKKVMVK